MKSILRCAALAAAASSGAAPAADGPDCSGWNTRAFFETAAAADIEICLDGGADVNARDERGVTPLHWVALHNPEPGVATELIRLGADVNARDEDGQTPLHLAALLNSSPGVIAVLADAGADIEARLEDGQTPLHLAADWNSRPGVIAELARGRRGGHRGAAGGRSDTPSSGGGPEFQSRRDRRACQARRGRERAG